MLIVIREPCTTKPHCSSTPIARLSNNPPSPPATAPVANEMVSSQDFVREAVLAAVQAETRINQDEPGASPERKIQTIADTRPKKRKPPVKASENWKKLQKTLTKSAHPPRAVRKRARATLRGPVANLEKPTDEEKFSSFMKRGARNTDNVTRVVALDCEMVGVGREGKENALARVSIVNYAGDVLYDSFVKVTERVTDYRTQWSGVRPEDVSSQSQKAVEPFTVQRAVGEILKGRIVVGHAIKNDLRVLRISHPWRDIRDTSDFYKKLWKKQGRRGGRGPALRAVVAQVLGVDTFQKDEHDSCEDARAALALYKRNAKEWETSLRKKGSHQQATRKT